MKKELGVMIVVAVGILGAESAQAQIPVKATLQSRQEVPAISGNGKGTFTGTISADLRTLDWELTYSGLGSDVTQAHIHFAQPGVNGGIMLFLCSNLGNGPVGTPACPNSGTVSGSADGADMSAGAAAQGVAAGEFFELQRALRQNLAYVNVHSTVFPGGELRGLITLAPSTREAPEE